MSEQENVEEVARHAPVGQLYASDGTLVRVGITHRDEDILLVVLDDPGTLYEQPLTGLTLESTGGRGVLRTPGTGQRVDTNLIRFFTDDAADVVQRREFVRVAAVQRVVFVDAEDNVIADTITINLSGGGMLVRRPASAVLEGELFFDLYLGDLGDEGRISGTARVIRHVGVEETAMGFSDIGHKDRERLIHFIFDKQRHALAVTRGDIV